MYPEKVKSVNKGEKITCPYCKYSWKSLKDMSKRKLKRVYCGMCSCAFDVVRMSETELVKHEM